MPLLGNRPFHLAKPLEDVKPTETIYTISHTKEQFRNKDEYEKRLALYADKVWTCKCTGHIHLTHEDAWRSEEERLLILKKQFPSYFEQSVLEEVHHSMDQLDNLVDKCWTKLQQLLMPNEPVTLKVKTSGQIIHGKIVKRDETVVIDTSPEKNGAAEGDESKCSSPSSDKENKARMEGSQDGSPKKWTPPRLLPYKYSLKIDNQGKIINGIPASDLTRKVRPPNKELVKLFIRSYALRPGNNPKAPWVVEEELVNKYKLPSKFADFFIQTMMAELKTSEGGKSKRKLSDTNLPSSKKAKLSKETKQSLSKKSKSLTSLKGSLVKSFSKSPLPKKSSSPKKVAAKSSEIVVSSDSEDDMALASIKNHAGESAASADSESNDSDVALADLQTDKKAAKSSPKKGGEKKKRGRPPKADSAKKASVKSSPSPKKVYLGDTSDRSVKFCLSRRGRKKLVYKDYSFILNRSYPDGSRAYWRCEFFRRSCKSSIVTDSENHVISASEHCHPPDVPPPKEAMKQMTILEMSQKPGRGRPRKSPASSPRKVDSPVKIPRVALRLQEALKQNDKALIKQLLTRCVNELSKPQRENLPPDIRPIVLNKYNLLEEKRKMRKMSPAQKEKQRQKLKEEQLAQRVLLKNAQQKILNQKLEDTELDHKPLPIPKLVPTPEGIANELFGDVAMITDFINCYRGLLMGDEEEPVSAEQLMQSLVASAGMGYLGQILKILLQTLLQDGIAEDYKEIGMPLADVSVTQYNAAELMRLCLRKQDRDDVDMEDQEDNEEDEQVEAAVESLETTDLNSLAADEKLRLLVSLCYRLMGSYSVQDYMEEKAQSASSIWRERIAKLKAKNDKLKEEKQKKKEEKKKGGEAAAVSKTDTDQPESSDKEKSVTITSFYGAASAAAEEEATDSDDLASIVKKRRVMAAKAAEEKARREREDKIRREKEYEEQRRQREDEQFEKQFQDTITTAKLVMRRLPFGTDRNHSRYWSFPSAARGLYVEKGWAGEHMRYTVKDKDSGSCSEDDQPRSPVKKKGRKRKNSMREAETTFPHTGQNLWFVYDTKEDVEKLLESLHPYGIRESALKAELQKQNPHIIKQLENNKKAGDGDEAASSVVDLVEGFRQEMLDMETRLRHGGLGGVPDYQTWEHNLNSSSTIKDLGMLLIECQTNILEKFLKGMLAKKEPKKKVQEAAGEEEDSKAEDTQEEKEEEVEMVSPGIERWTEAVQTCPTLSRLHMLLSMLESSIKWEKSAENAKCKICRKKRDDDVLLLCDECNQAFHMYCMRPALLEVPNGDWFCPACVPASQRRSRTRERKTDYKELAAVSSDEDAQYDSEEEGGSASDAIVHEEHCTVCGEDADLVLCSSCPSAFHLGCHDPPLRHTPRSNWVCQQCKTGIRIKPKPKKRAARQCTSRKRYYLYEESSSEEEEDDTTSEEEEEEEESEEEEEEELEEDGEEYQEEEEEETQKKSERNSKTKAERRSSTQTRSTETSRGSRSRHSDPVEYPLPKTSRSRPRSSGQMNGVDDDDMELCMKIIDRLAKNRNAWAFREPVDSEVVPDYYDIVQNPVDFLTMKLRCQTRDYKSPQAFINDVALMFSNAQLYNAPDSEVGKCIGPLEGLFQELKEKFLPDCTYERKDLYTLPAVNGTAESESPSEDEDMSESGSGLENYLSNSSKH